MIDTLILTIKSIDYDKYKRFIFENQLQDYFNINLKDAFEQYSLSIPFQGDIENIIYISFNNNLNSLKIQSNYSKLLYNTQLNNIYYLETEKYIDILYTEIKKYIPITRQDIETSIIYRIDIPANMNMDSKPEYYTSLMNINTQSKESYYRKVNYIDTIRYETNNLKIQFYDKLKEILSKSKSKNNPELQNELLKYKNILRLEYQIKFKGKDRILLTEIDSIIYDMIEKNYDTLINKILYRINNNEYKPSNIYQIYMTKRQNPQNKIMAILIKNMLQNEEGMNTLNELLMIIKEKESKQLYRHYKNKVQNILKTKDIKDNNHAKELLKKLEEERGKYRKMRLVNIKQSKVS